MTKEDLHKGWIRTYVLAFNRHVIFVNFATAHLQLCSFMTDLDQAAN